MERKVIQRQFKEILRDMEFVETNQCFERLFCDIASEQNEFKTLSPILNILSIDEDITAPHRTKYLQLKKAEKLGTYFKSMRVCEDSFKCLTTGVDLMDNTIRVLK